MTGGLACLEIRHYDGLEWSKDTPMSSLAAPSKLSSGGLSAPSFPGSTVETLLRAELVAAVEAEAAIKGIRLPSSPSAIASTGFHVDSLVVVSLICAVESVVGFELPESVVRAGGYASIERALAHLVPNIERQWIKHAGGKS
jgi:hypothetical protein